MSGFEIHKTIKRADKRLIELFRGLPVANIDDCMNRIACADSEIRPLNGNPLLGPAFTVKVAEGDNLMFHKAMDLAMPGDIIVIDAGGFKNRAIFGEIMITYCQKRGIAGVIVDGSIRDSDALSKMDIPVYARGVTPNGPYKNGPGVIGGTISFGGIVINPGDIIVGDADGIIAIHPEEAEALAKEVRAVSEKEAGLIKRIEDECVYSRPWVDEKLAQNGCAYIDE